ncbi:MAG: 50S ribosomal protein L5 [Planctomycetes bacterium]|nr:50S ribosomal protein L5 [Planctomycetota bacterium]
MEAQESKKTPAPRLKDKYRDEVFPKIKEKYSLENVMEVPKIQKVVVNMGVGGAKENKSMLEAAVRDLGIITGQKPMIAKARASVAGFKLREGMPIGCKVTLRGTRMWEFLDRLISVAIPRIRDFRGLSRKSFDGRGNYSMGIGEQIVFPEIDLDSVQFVQGMDIAIVTTAPNDAMATDLLELLGMPFKK